MKYPRMLSWVLVLLAGLITVSCHPATDRPITMKPRVLTNLQAFRARNKFADAEWKARGLNLSDSTLSARMDSLFNTCADKLIKQVAGTPAEQQLRQTLSEGLESFDSSDYDTEEKEFIVDYFYGLSQFVGLDIKKDLNKWMYGSLLTAAMSAVSFFKKPEKVLETLSHDCSKCGVALKTFITEKRAEIPSAAFGIAQCSACGELNLLEIGNGVGQFRVDNFRVLKWLDRQSHKPEQAKAVLEQLKTGQ